MSITIEWTTDGIASSSFGGDGLLGGWPQYCREIVWFYYYLVLLYETSKEPGRWPADHKHNWIIISERFMHSINRDFASFITYTTFALFKYSPHPGFCVSKSKTNVLLGPRLQHRWPIYSSYVMSNHCVFSLSKKIYSNCFISLRCKISTRPFQRCPCPKKCIAPNRLHVSSSVFNVAVDLGNLVKRLETSAIGAIKMFSLFIFFYNG